MYNPDLPIETAENDELGRAPFAEALGDSILAYDNKASLVLGLLGSWGVGKTSLLNMAMEHIIRTTAEADTPPLIMRFNPWNFTEQNQLISQFFVQLANLLNKPDHAANARKAGEELKKYSTFFRPLRLIPGAGEYAKLAEDIASRVGDAALSWAELKDADLDAQRKDLNKLLAGLTQKIVITIDDIDRLNNHEIRQIFQLVKLIADFPNTVYLLSFDKQVVAEALREVQPGDPQLYLEKIVQVEFDVPEASQSDIERYLFSNLDSILTELPEGTFDKTRWGNIYHGSLRFFFNSMRDAVRFLNAYRFSYQLVGKDLNLVDFIAITALKVFEPNVLWGFWPNAQKGIFQSLRARSNS